MTIVYTQNFDALSPPAVPASWTVPSGKGTWLTTTAHPISSPNALINTPAVDGSEIVCTAFTAIADMEIRYDFTSQETMLGVLLRSDLNAQNCYALVTQNTNGTVYDVYKIVSGSASHLGSINTGYSSGTGGGQQISVRARIKGSTIQIKIWPYATAEPTYPAGSSLTDTSITAAGYFGFYSNILTSGGNTVDNVVVDDTTVGALVAGTSSSLSIGTTSATVTNPGASGGTSPYTYQWYRSTTSGFAPGGGNIISGATSLILNDTGLTAGTTYYYKNIVTDSVGATATSSQLSIATSTGSNVLPVNDSAFFTQGFDLLPVGAFGVSVPTLQATAPGSYLKFNTMSTVNLRLGIDNATNSGFPTNEMPIVRYSINGAAFVDVQLAPGQTTLTLSSSLSTGTNNQVEVYFKQSSNTNSFADVWGSSGVSPTNVLRINNVTVDSGGTVSAPVLLPLRGVIAGDSITAAEHANPDGSDDSTGGFAPLLARALNMEFVQQGYGGSGWTVFGGSNAPPFPTSWNYYSFGRPRPLSGLDYYAVVHGGNDARSSVSGSTIRAAVQTWLVTARAALGPTTKILIIVECMGSYASDLSAAVSAYKSVSDDANVYFIDATPMLPAGVFTLSFASGPFQWTFDGVHPLIYGHSRIAAACSNVIGTALTSLTSPTTPSHQLKRARS